ncbi:GNAT family N-acetyltransferase [Haliangium sp.]|uniref:GNAT family N-acetyltransferase n=1 Tax=Haliangium sp. TaxID=2663208 RepID=UPI003D0FF9C5
MRLPLRPLTRADLDSARALLEAACAFDPAAAVAEEVLFGPALGFPAESVRALGASEDGALVGLIAACGAWLRVLAVHPERRGRGLGSELLAAGEAEVARSGASLVRVLDQPGNYLAPGVDVRNRATIGWLERRGYHHRGVRENLIVDVASDSRARRDHAQALALALPGYELRRARPDDADALRALIAGEFSDGWAFEVTRALGHAPPAVHLAVHRDDDAITAFAAHDGNNRGLGWFGPAGTLPAHRGRGLGSALLSACLADVAEAGHVRCEVAWIGPREFYERAAAVVGERHFAVLRKEIPGDPGGGPGTPPPPEEASP